MRSCSNASFRLTGVVHACFASIKVVKRRLAQLLREFTAVLSSKHVLDKRKLQKDTCFSNRSCFGLLVSILCTRKTARYSTVERVFLQLGIRLIHQRDDPIHPIIFPNKTDSSNGSQPRDLSVTIGHPKFVFE